MKKTISIIIAIATIFSIAVPAFAEAAAVDERNETAPVFEIILDIAGSPEGEPEADETLTADPDEPDSGNETAGEYIYEEVPVAVIYLCASGPHSYYAFGHTWVCIKNISEEDITVAGKTIAPGEMVSFGLHHDGGLHFNREIDRFNGENVTVKEKMLTGSELSAVENEISDSKWGWYELFSHNCTNFATSVWNRATGAHLFAFCFPFIVKLQMALGGTKTLSMTSY